MLTQERLKELLHYDPETGVFTRIIAISNKKPGDIVGCDNGLGYLRVSIENKSRYLHHLAWLYTYGEWPKNDIDHIDGNPSNNRIANLRDVTAFINMQNQRVANADSKSGVLGISFHKESKKWMARITINSKQKYLGYYSKPEEAHQAYLIAKRKYHPGCTI